MMFNWALTEDRFDQLTQRLATASLSRRGAIGVIGGVFAGAVVSTSFGIERASAQPGQLPQQIYVIRHGEKPPEPLPGQSDLSSGPRSASTSTGIATHIRCRRRDGNGPAH
jgi:hypothetical protein